VPTAPNITVSLNFSMVAPSAPIVKKLRKSLHDTADFGCRKYACSGASSDTVLWKGYVVDAVNAPVDVVMEPIWQGWPPTSTNIKLDKCAPFMPNTAITRFKQVTTRCRSKWTVTPQVQCRNARWIARSTADLVMHLHRMPQEMDLAKPDGT